MILQEIYHQLEEWIIMLNSPDFKNTDASIVQDEMMKLCGKIWMNRGKEFDSQEKENVFSSIVQNNSKDLSIASPDASSTFSELEDKNKELILRAKSIWEKEKPYLFERDDYDWMNICLTALKLKDELKQENKSKGCGKKYIDSGALHLERVCGSNQGRSLCQDCRKQENSAPKEKQ